MAENGHNVWAVARIRQGWTYGKSNVSWRLSQTRRKREREEEGGGGEKRTKMRKRGKRRRRLRQRRRMWGRWVRRKGR